MDTNPFDPDERRLGAMEDQSGFPRDRAKIALGKKVVSGATELPQFAREKRKPRRTGHVRGFHEGELRLSEEFPNSEPLSSEQNTANDRWLAQIRSERADADIQRIIDDVNRMIPINPDDVTKSEAERERMLNARLRTHFERSKRR